MAQASTTRIHRSSFPSCSVFSGWWYLVGGFNPSWKNIYWKIGENKIKPPTRYGLTTFYNKWYLIKVSRNYNLAIQTGSWSVSMLDSILQSQTPLSFLGVHLEKKPEVPRGVCCPSWKNRHRDGDINAYLNDEDSETLQHLIIRA